MYADVCADVKIRYAGEGNINLAPYERAAAGAPLPIMFAKLSCVSFCALNLKSDALPGVSAAFIFFNFILSISATVFALKAIEEIKTKQREEYNRLSVLSDTLQYEVDA